MSKKRCHDLEDPETSSYINIEIIDEEEQTPEQANEFILSLEEITHLVILMTSGIFFGNMSEYEHYLLCHQVVFECDEIIQDMAIILIFANNLFRLFDFGIIPISDAIFKEINEGVIYNLQFFDYNVARKIYLARSATTLINFEIKQIEWRLACYSEIQILTAFQYETVCVLEKQRYAYKEELCNIMHVVAWDSVD
jgi:hypothetical protein